MSSLHILVISVSFNYCKRNITHRGRQDFFSSNPFYLFSTRQKKKTEYQLPEEFLTKQGKKPAAKFVLLLLL